MRLLVFALSLLAWTAQAATLHTEFYVQNGTGGYTGDNLNAGSTTNNAAVLTYAGGTFVRSTGVFTVASGNPVSDPVNLGDWASIYTTAGATVATFVARVTGTNATTITVSLTAIAGATSSVSEGAGAATCKIGGAWLGPNSAVAFPFNFAAGTMTNAAGDSPRINIMSGTTYAITAAITHSIAGPTLWQGYTTTLGDGGKATIDCSTSGAGVNIFTLSCVNNDFVDLIASNSGATSGTSTDGIAITGAENTLTRIVVHDVRKNGFNMTGGSHLIECEAYNCNKANSSGVAGYSMGVTGGTALRCISHDNSGNQCLGFAVPSASILINCIAESNGKDGVSITASTTSFLLGCDLYNNTGSGIDLTSATAAAFVIQNCNLVKNGAYGISSSGSATLRNGRIVNCGFGSGTMTNSSGGIAAMAGIEVVNPITYSADVTPWVDPANGDFRINLAAAEGTGRGSFTQTAASYSGTVAYPDVGAAQRTSVQSGGTTTVVHSFPIFQ